jgi:hypothetical protein
LLDSRSISDRTEGLVYGHPEQEPHETLSASKAFALPFRIHAIEKIEQGVVRRVVGVVTIFTTNLAADFPADRTREFGQATPGQLGLGEGNVFGVCAVLASQHVPGEGTRILHRILLWSRGGPRGPLLTIHIIISDSAFRVQQKKW